MSMIILNKMSATATIQNVVAPANTINGGFLTLGTQNTDKTYVGAAPTAVTDVGMVMVLDVPLSYEAEKLEKDYVINTGDVVRGFVPYIGMTVSIPQANITATSALATGKVFVPKAGVIKGECLAAAVGTESLVFAIDELYTKAGVAMAKVRCVKAQV